MCKLYDTVLSMTRAANTVSTNPTLNAFDEGYCKELESQAATDAFIKSRVKKTVKELKLAKTIDYNDHYKSAFDAYNEAVSYLLIKKRGFAIEGIHETSSPTPDFKVEFPYKDGYSRNHKATIYIEVKSLAYSDGNLEYNRVQEAAFRSKVDMEEQRKQGRSFCTSLYEISPLGENSYGPSAEIEALIRKIENNIKRDQYTYGNRKDTILLVDLSQYDWAFQIGDCLPVYPNNLRGYSESGRLWMLAFAKKNERIFKAPEFAGKGNFDRDLLTKGILNKYRYIKGIIFTSGCRATDKTIFGFYRHKELDLKTATFIQQFCDFANDDLNTFGHKYYKTIKKKTPMFNLDKFISDSVTHRPVSMFEPDIQANADTLTREIKGKKICVIGGAGSIGSSFIKAVLRFEPKIVVVVDLNENGLAELVRDIRSTQGLYVPDEFRCYTLNFADPIFERIFREEKGFDVVANFSAHKHVRSEKDRYSVQALIENNDIKAKKLMDLLKVYPPKHFFCVSTDKAANPVNIMGASKRIMEDLVMAYNQYFKVTTARFANVAFSNGSLPDGWIHRLQKKQPLVAPSDVKRYFVSPEESGQICMLACILGNGGEVFFPKLGEDQMLTFSAICDEFVKAEGFEKDLCTTDAEAVLKASQLKDSELTTDSQLSTLNSKLKYPVRYFASDTTGEKAYEEFYVPGEKIDMQRFQALGVVEQTTRHDKAEVDAFFQKLEAIFAKDDFTKAEVVDAIREFIPNFQHEERGKNLDQKM